MKMSIAFQVLQPSAIHYQISMPDHVDALRLENGGGFFAPSGFRLAGTGVNHLLNCNYSNIRGAGCPVINQERKQATRDLEPTK